MVFIDVNWNKMLAILRNSGLKFRYRRIIYNIHKYLTSSSSNVAHSVKVLRHVLRFYKKYLYKVFVFVSYQRLYLFSGITCLPGCSLILSAYIVLGLPLRTLTLYLISNTFLGYFLSLTHNTIWYNTIILSISIILIYLI